jgi:hypothetical protein
VAKRKKQRRAREKTPTIDYVDPEGNVLTLRQTLSAGTIAKVGEPPAGDAASQDDAWHRRYEVLFERLAVRWEIASTEPITRQKELLARFRFASVDERKWIRGVLREHLTEHFPDMEAPCTRRGSPGCSWTTAWRSSRACRCR